MPLAAAILDIKLSTRVLTSFARQALLSYLKVLSVAHSLDEETQFLSFSLAFPEKPRAADKRVVAAVYNAIVCIRQLEIKVEASPRRAVEGGDGTAQGDDTRLTAGESPAAVLKALSLYLLSISASQFSGYAPKAIGVMADILIGKGMGSPGVDELIRRYSCVKSRAVMDLRMLGSPSPELIDSVESTLDEVKNLHPKLGPSQHEGVVSLAPESSGASLSERVVVVQVARNIASEPKLMSFLLGYRKNGIYVKPLEDFEKRYREVFQSRLQKKGFLEFSLLVSAGIDYKRIIECMLDSGALKREILRQREPGYSDIHPGYSVRISEWLKRPGGLYRSVLDSRMEKIPTYLCIVDHAY